MDFQWEPVQSFEVPGQPIGKGRPKFARAGFKVRTYTPKKTLEFEKRVAVFFRGKMISPDVPIRFRMRFVFNRPKRLMRKADPPGLIPHLCKPDGDNVEKAILDSLSGVAYRDDSQVFGSSWTKFYAEKATPKKSRVEIEIFTLQPTTKNENRNDMAPSTSRIDTSGGG